MWKLRCPLVENQFKILCELSNRTFISDCQSCHATKSHVKTLKMLLSIHPDQVRLKSKPVKFFHTSCKKDESKKPVDEVDSYDEYKSLMYTSEFNKKEIKNKKTFLEVVKIYSKNVKNRAGHVDFIKAALKNMKEFGVHRDLESYKKILDVFPKGVYVCSNVYLIEGMYYSRQQFVAMDLLEQMANNGVIPDFETGIMIKNIFGEKSYPGQKYSQILYWSCKWKNKSPFLLPRPIPSDPLMLAKLAIKRITSVDIQTDISVFQTASVADSIDKTWIVSGQSPKQKKLLAKHPEKMPVIVEGGDLVWLREKPIHYFVLKADGEPLPFTSPKNLDDLTKLESKFFNPNYLVKENEGPTVHEQDDGTIYAVCATGTSSKDSLLSWVRILEKNDNPTLANVPVLFRFRQREMLPTPYSDKLVQPEN